MYNNLQTILAMNSQIINNSAGTNPGLPTAGTNPGRRQLIGMPINYFKLPTSRQLYLVAS